MDVRSTLDRARQFFAEATDQRHDLAAVVEKEIRRPGWSSRRGNIRRHCPNGSVTVSFMRAGVRHSYHVTKGWRQQREAPAPVVAAQ